MGSLSTSETSACDVLRVVRPPETCCPGSDDGFLNARSQVRSLSGSLKLLGFLACLPASPSPLSSAETKLFPDRSVVDECAHHVLQDGEHRDQKAEHQRLPESGDQEGSIVEPLSEVEDLTDENHLGEDQRLQESQPYSKYPI